MVGILVHGNNHFILSGQPHLEEAYWFGEGVMPILRKSGLLAEPVAVAVDVARLAELAVPLASHMDVNALDLWIADEEQDAAAAQLACNNVKRVRRHGEPPQRFWFTDAAQGPGWIEAFMEIKTVWHPAGV